MTDMVYTYFAKDEDTFDSQSVGWWVEMMDLRSLRFRRSDGSVFPASEIERAADLMQSGEVLELIDGTGHTYDIFMRWSDSPEFACRDHVPGEADFEWCMGGFGG